MDEEGQVHTINCRGGHILQMAGGELKIDMTKEGGHVL